MIITKLKLGIITAALSLIAIPTASAHAISYYKKPVLVKIAHILDIKVNVLTRELRSGESIMEIAEEYDATKSEIKEIKKVLRIAKSPVVKIVEPIITKKVVKTVVIVKRVPVRRVVVKHVVVAPIVIKKVLHVVHVKRPTPIKPVVPVVKKVAAILDTTVASVRSDLRQGDTLVEIAKENDATKREMKQIKNIQNKRTRGHK